MANTVSLALSISPGGQRTHHGLRRALATDDKIGTAQHRDTIAAQHLHELADMVRDGVVERALAQKQRDDVFLECAHPDTFTIGVGLLARLDLARQTGASAGRLSRMLVAIGRSVLLCKQSARSSRR